MSQLVRVLLVRVSRKARDASLRMTGLGGLERAVARYHVRYPTLSREEPRAEDGAPEVGGGAREKQIPFGNDRKKDNDNDVCRLRFLREFGILRRLSALLCRRVGTTPLRCNA